MKKLLLTLTLLAMLFFLGASLNPFSPTMFTFHDSTQPSRIQQFVLNLRQLKIPPRIAPDYNYGLGFPVFNFYAPAAYWITSVFSLMGFDVVSSLKLSFLIALVVGFIGSYLLLKQFFEQYASLLGSMLYITSLYFSLNIFVRGNLAELWFLALFPSALFLLIRNTIRHDKRIFLITAVTLSLALTAHNIYSLLFVPIALIFILLLKNKKRNFFSLVLAVLLSAYFWLPALAEMKYTWVKEVATMTNFRDHFLCPSQLWQSPWGFGGSTRGCINDGMSFKIGKLQLVFFFLGFLTLIYKRKFSSHTIFFLILTAASLLLTIKASQPIWERFSFVFSIVQFPWRFIGFSLPGIAFFSAYFWHHLEIPAKPIFIFLLVILIFAVQGKYFKGQTISKWEFEQRYLSQGYIEKKAAYSIAEYLPKTINYLYWRSFEKKEEALKEFLATASIAPFNLRRQTDVERTANAITLLGFAGLLVASNKKWKT